MASFQSLQHLPTGIYTISHHKVSQSSVNKDNNGKLKLKPKNFYTKKQTNAFLDSELFMRPGYLALGDTYKDGAKLKLRDYKPTKTAPFKAGTHHYSATPYPYTEIGPKLLQDHRDENGKIKLAPRGFFTNAMKPGIANATTKYSPH